MNVTPAGRPLQGILIPESLTVWTAETTLTESEPRPGVPSPERPTRMRLATTGTPVDVESFEILASVGGVPGGGRNDDAGGARFLQRPTTDPESDWRGYDPPTSITSVEIGATTSFLAYSPSAVQLADGTEVLVVEDHGVGSGYNTKVIRAYRRSPAGSWGSAITIATLQSLGEASPVVVLTETGRLDVYALDAIGTSRRVVRYSSADDGETWELAAPSCLRLDTVASAVATRLRVAVGSGQVLLIVLYSPNVARRAQQFASSDDGATFELIGTYEDAWCLGIMYDSGLFHAIWQIDDTSGVQASHVALGSAFTEQDPASGTLFANDTGAEQTPIPTLAGGIWSDPSGILYVALPTVDNTGTHDRNVPIWLSVDGGRAWSSLGTLLAESSEGAGWTHSLSIRRSRSGALACWSTVDPSGPTYGDTVYVARLGGWSTVTMPGQYDLPASATQIPGWDRVWIATEGISLEDGGTWAETLTGSPTKTLGPLSWRISGSSATDATYVYDLAAQSEHGHVRIAIDPTGGDGTTYVTLEVAQDASPDRTYRMRLELYYDLAQYQIVDVGDSSVIFGPAAIPASAFEVWMAIGRSSFAAANGIFAGQAWRRLLSGDPEDREWVELVDTDALTVSTATDPNTSKVTIESNPAGSAAWDLTLRYVQVDLASINGAGLGPARSVDTLFGAPFTPRGQYVRDGVSVRAEGLCRRLDTWAIVPSYVYGIEQALPTTLADPRRGHKALTADDGYYAFELSGGDVPRGGLWGIYVDGITWDQVSIAIYSGGAWVPVGTVTLGEPVEYDATGRVAYPDEAPLRPRYYGLDELAGCWLEDGGDIYEIAGNREGTWSTAGQRVELKLDASPAGGIGTIRFRRGLILLYLADGETFSAIRIGPEKCFTDALESAVLAIGRVVVLGDGWDATVGTARDLGEELTETTTGGAAVARTRRDRRVVELSHQRPIATGHVEHYVRALTSGPAVATAGDPRVLDGLLGSVGRSPIVVLPRIPVLPGSANAATAFGGEASGAVYGRYVPETYRRDLVYDDPEGWPVERGSTLTIVEEVG